jgi:peptidyl-prolyl cis-trans isomerase D
MMTGMREASKGAVGKIVVGILMSLLILSFAVWGINDVFTGGGARDVATVGKEKITQAEYSEAYRRLLQRVQRERGVTPTSAEMRAQGVDRRLLESLVGDAAIDGKAKALGLAYSVEDAAKSIVKDPRFQQEGTFNRDMFNGFLQNANMTENTYLRELVSSTLRSHISEAIGGNAAAPKVLEELFHKRSTEERSISFIRITDGRISPVAAPDDATLKTYFDTNQTLFRAPEYRAVTYLSIAPSDFADEIQVSDAEIQKEYTDGLAAGRYGTPERRTIQQLTFQTEAAAASALTRIRSGTSFDSIAAETSQMGTLDAGSRSKAEIGIPALADPIFALAAGGVTEPIAIGGQFQLVRVVSIAPAVVPALDDTLKSAVTIILRAQKLQSDTSLRKRLSDLNEAIEELRGSGKTLAEIATEKKLKVVTVSAIDAAGRDKEDKAVTLPEAQRFLTAIFASAVGVDNEAITTAGNGFTWFEMTGKEEARNLTFDEAKAKVTERWIEEEKARRISAKTDELLKKMQGGQTLEQIATELTASVETQAGLKRLSQPFGQTAGTALFITPLNTPAIASVSRLESILFVVTGSTTPPIDENADAAKQTRALLDNLVGDDVVTQYVSGILSTQTVQINQASLDAVLGSQ